MNEELGLERKSVGLAVGHVVGLFVTDELGLESKTFGLVEGDCVGL